MSSYLGKYIDIKFRENTPSFKIPLQDSKEYF